MRKIANGDTVTVHYTGKLEDGSVFDTSLTEGREPLTVTLGQKSLIPGFELGLIDMTEGETKTVNIPSDEAYGDHDPSLVFPVPNDKLPEGITPGVTLTLMTPAGPSMITVVSVNEDETATLDHNHPLAGKSLTFELEVVTISDTVEEVVNN
jgi:FKBP-type peptidyl-prolyl cis-trans isomerase 2